MATSRFIKVALSYLFHYLAQELENWEAVLENGGVEEMDVSIQIEQLRQRIEEGKNKREIVRREMNRRRHNMLPFIFHLIKWLHHNTDFLKNIT
jgi:hypothetical protein